jgi:hypothetical protein
MVHAVQVPSTSLPMDIRSTNAPIEGIGNTAPVLETLFYLSQLQACQNLAQGTQKNLFIYLNVCKVFRNFVQKVK